MKKNISINIGGIIFHIEEDGYDRLKNYLDSINDYFSSFEDNKEIVNDIESRIAEIFLSKLDEGKQIITIEDIDDLERTMGTTKDFEASIDTETKEEETTTDAKDESFADDQAKANSSTKPPKRLYRDLNRTVIGGVASGLAHYFKIDPIWVRLLFLAALFNIVFWGVSGFALLTYIVLWIVVPGNTNLVEDEKIKKLFRSPSDKVLGGVAGGIAAYFGADPVLIRLLFVVSIFLGGAGIIAYLILWIITPEAKTLTEKMQMQGEPVTLSNIEQNVKKNLNEKEGEESAFAKILLFPFRLLAMIFQTLSTSMGPLLKFLVEALRIATGVILIILGFTIVVSLTAALAVLFGFGASLESWISFGGFSALEISETLGVLGIIATYFLGIIPAIAFGLIGLTIVAKKSLVKPYVGWSLLGVWIIALVTTLIILPSIANEFRVENTFNETKRFSLTPEVPTLTLNQLDSENFNRVQLQLRGTSDSLNYTLEMDFESRGPSRAQAKENASLVEYGVLVSDNTISFDSDLTFDDAPFRFQRVEATFYIPYGKVFRMDYELHAILRNTLYLNGYRAGQMEGNEWVFDQNGIQCLTCQDNPRSNDQYNDNYREYKFMNFSELKLISGFDFEISQNDEYSIVLIGDENELDDVYFEQRGDVLEIRRKGLKKWWNREDWETVEIKIEMPELEELEVTGASKGKLFDFENRDMELTLTGASELWAKVNPDILSINASGASNITLNGRADELNASLTGASILDGYGFNVDEADIDVIGASSAKVTVREYLRANATGASNIRYKGEPEINASSTGLSSVKKY
jgi:phage shock protein PspC (stress-responsive transcriptional regulator)